MLSWEESFHANGARGRADLAGTQGPRRKKPARMSAHTRATRHKARREAATYTYDSEMTASPFWRRLDNGGQMKVQKSALASIALVLLLATTCAFAQGRQEFQAQAFGTGT